MRRDENGDYWLRGAEGALGAALLHFAYVDSKLPDSLKGIRLAEATESVDRALHIANIPIRWAR